MLFAAQSSGRLSNPHYIIRWVTNKFLPPSGAIPKKIINWFHAHEASCKLNSGGNYYNFAYNVFNLPSDCDYSVRY